MSSWSRQKGFPVVTVERNYETERVTLSQRRYASYASTTPDVTAWWIPYNLATASSANFDETRATHWMDARTMLQEITVSGLNNSDWLIINKRVCV